MAIETYQPWPGRDGRMAAGEDKGEDGGEGCSTDKGAGTFSGGNWSARLPSEQCSGKAKHKHGGHGGEPSRAEPRRDTRGLAHGRMRRACLGPRARVLRGHCLGAFLAPSWKASYKQSSVRVRRGTRENHRETLERMLRLVHSYATTTKAAMKRTRVLAVYCILSSFFFAGLCTLATIFSFLELRGTRQSHQCTNTDLHRSARIHSMLVHSGKKIVMSGTFYTFTPRNVSVSTQ
jgi:hypothetical protein